jgi:UDP-N-acetylglucosamine transferase subunit ALG13
MILVTVGTIQFPFVRMVRVVSKIIKLYPSLQIVVQSGHTNGFNTLKKYADIRAFIPQHELWQLMKQSQILLMHGGEGSLLDATEWSPNLPIVFPRNMQYGEHVDNFQLEIAQAADAKKLCHAAFTEDEVLQKISEYHRQKHQFKNYAISKTVQNNQLIDYLTKLSGEWNEKR